MKQMIPPKAVSTVIALLCCGFLTLSGCDRGPDSPRGFSLPKGDPEQGQAVFIKYQCLACHSIDSVADDSIEKELSVVVPLGGEVRKTKTYAELVTSVINPSHRIAKVYMKGLINADGSSKMRNYNDVMTVTELIDLVAFLQPHFEVVDYEETYYNIYP